MYSQSNIDISRWVPTFFGYSETFLVSNPKGKSPGERIG
jgi:hypothetical protein